MPFQAAAEEYAFRGIMVQAIGSWLPRRWWTRIVVVLVTTGLFVSGHMYELWGLLDVGIFGLGALWVTLRTGGLEAAIALHVVNNVTVFAMLASGVWGTTTQATDGGSLIGVILSAITTIGYCAAVELTARRWQLQRTSPWPEVGSTQAPDVPMPEARVLGAAELAGVGTVAGAEVGVGAGGTAGAGGWGAGVSAGLAGVGLLGQSDRPG
ncbi:CPBP family intramembrane glutamic endopeptidase [Salana multivorans]